MDPRDFSAGKLPKRELQGPRPTPLRVQKGSHKIRKPPAAPPQQQPPQQQPPQQHHHRPQQQPPHQHRPPVIIYTVSPKVIHADPSEFRTLVQRLTGSSSSSSSSSPSSFLTNNTGSNSISPAARFASIEKTIKSPERKSQSGDRMSSVVEGIERTSLFPGILSPGPAALPTIPPNFFSPPSDPSPLNFFHDLSPLLRGNNKNYIEGISFSPSPSGFLSPHIITSSSTPTLDAFNNFFDF